MNELVFLVVVSFTGSGNGIATQHFKVNTMQECIESVKVSHIYGSNGNEAEGAIALFCTSSKKD